MAAAPSGRGTMRPRRRVPQSSRAACSSAASARGSRATSSPRSTGEPARFILEPAGDARDRRLRRRAETVDAFAAARRRDHTTCGAATLTRAATCATSWSPRPAALHAFADDHVGDVRTLHRPKGRRRAARRALPPVEPLGEALAWIAKNPALREDVHHSSGGIAAALVRAAASSTSAGRAGAQLRARRARVAAAEAEAEAEAAAAAASAWTTTTCAATATRATQCGDGGGARGKKGGTTPRRGGGCEERTRRSAARPRRHLTCALAAERRRSAAAAAAAAGADADAASLAEHRCRRRSRRAPKSSFTRRKQRRRQAAHRPAPESSTCGRLAARDASPARRRRCSGAEHFALADERRACGSACGGTSARSPTRRAVPRLRRRSPHRVAMMRPCRHAPGRLLRSPRATAPPAARSPTRRMRRNASNVSRWRGRRSVLDSHQERLLSSSLPSETRAAKLRPERAARGFTDGGPRVRPADQRARRPEWRMYGRRLFIRRHAHGLLRPDAGCRR